MQDTSRSTKSGPGEVMTVENKQKSEKQINYIDMYYVKTKLFVDSICHNQLPMYSIVIQSYVGVGKGEAKNAIDY